MVVYLLLVMICVEWLGFDTSALLIKRLGNARFLSINVFPCGEGKSTSILISKTLVGG